MMLILGYSTVKRLDTQLLLGYYGLFGVSINPSITVSSVRLGTFLNDIMDTGEYQRALDTQKMVRGGLVEPPQYHECGIFSINPRGVF